MHHSSLPPNTLFLSPIVICLSLLFQALQSIFDYITYFFHFLVFRILYRHHTSKIFIASAFNLRAIIHSILSNTSLSAFEPLLLHFLEPFHLRSNALYKGHFLFNPYPTAFPYGNGMVLHFYQQQESSTTKTVHKVINKGLKAYV